MPEITIIERLYIIILPMMEADGIENTPVNRHGYLIGIRKAEVDNTAPQKSAFHRYLIIDALTDEINRLGNELGIDEEGNPKEKS